MASRMPNSPTSASFSFSRSPTHAGGILPSSSFFRPGRPADQPRYTPPASLASKHKVEEGERKESEDTVVTESDIVDINQQHPLPEGDAYPLSHLRHSLDHSHVLEEDGVHSNVHAQFTNTARSKQSREPLLPIGGSSKSPTANTFSHPNHSTLPSTSSVARVRTSIDRMFNRLSLSHTRNNPSIDSTDQRPRHRQSASMSKQPTYLTAHSESHHHRSSQSHASMHSSRSPSPAPSFIPVPPTPGGRYALSHVPRFRKPSSPPLPATTSEKPTSSKSPGSKPVWNYELHPSRNHFFLRGRLLTGGDSPYAFIFSVGIVTVLSALWGSTTAVFWWQHGRGAQAIVVIGGYLAVIVISCMFATAFTDPGILPRDLDPNPPYPVSSPSDGAPRGPMPRDLRVRNEVVRVKYCPTCRTYRPPRASHCKMCDNCVDGCDHHCQWVNNCIGRRNYTTFFCLLCAADLTLILLIVTSAIHLFLLTQSSLTPRNFHQALSTPRGIGSAIVFCLSILVVWPVSALLGYHIRLLFLNVTTIEQIRNQAYVKSALQELQEGEKLTKPPNPFTYGKKWRNIIGILCRPRGMSWAAFNEQATEDQRQINPGMLMEGRGYDDERIR